MWLCHHNSILVKEVIASRGISCDSVSPLCKCQRESIIHMPREYGVAFNFWRKIRVSYPLDNSFRDNLCDWLRTNCLSKLVHQSTIPWNILFPFAIWFLWKHIHIMVFENTIESQVSCELH